MVPPRNNPGLPGAALALVASLVGAGDLELHGVVSGRGLIVEGQRSWLEGGYGRLTEGAGEPNDALPAVRGQVHLGLDWKPTEPWLVHVHGVLQGEPSSSRGRRAGLVEGFLQFRPELSPRTVLRLRAGLFFPPTSLENTERLWQSPYTVTLSALNTWIGEEVRQSGFEAMLIRKTGADGRLELAATVFGGNDPSGALLAWRGWAFGDRLTTLGEVLPLPPLSSFEPGGGFADQRDGTQPTDELDSRPGWQARTRWSRGSALRLQAAYTDQGGDRRLYGGQYAWDTRFGQAGIESRLGPSFTLVAEAAAGLTAMGPLFPGGARVDLRFRVGYALLSWSRGALRLTVRADWFENEDRDGTAEPDEESGWAWTAAAFWQPTPYLRLGLEYLAVHAARPAAAFSGADPDTDARRALLEIRASF